MERSALSNGPFLTDGSNSDPYCQGTPVLSPLLPLSFIPVFWPFPEWSGVCLFLLNRPATYPVMDLSKLLVKLLFFFKWNRPKTQPYVSSILPFRTCPSASTPLPRSFTLCHYSAPASTLHASSRLIPHRFQLSPPVGIPSLTNISVPFNLSSVCLFALPLNWPSPS